MRLPLLYRSFISAVLASFLIEVEARSEAGEANPRWTSSSHFRLFLTVDPRRPNRSNSPASVDVDFQQLLKAQGVSAVFDEHTVEVVSLSEMRPENHPSDLVYPAVRVPHRIDKFFGSSMVSLHFVLPGSHRTNFAVYFDTDRSDASKSKRFHGLVGDGDRFHENHQRREIAACHFDCFADFDGDGDLDLFKGGVEPFVYCYENVGGNRLIDRGRLTSAGKLFTLPCSRSNRSWVSVAFYDLDGDGDQDFLPSFGDGPDAGRIIFYRNTTREQGGRLTFTRVGSLKTVSGLDLAGGAQAGGWFPSITLVEDWDGDGDGAIDAIVGSNHRCWLYRGLPSNDKTPIGRRTPSAPRSSSSPGDSIPLFQEPVGIQAGGAAIVLTNPRFDCADIDGDGDLDLFAGTQPGPVYWFKNVGTRSQPQFAPGKIIAFGEKFLIGDAHSGVKVAHFDGDRLLDVVAGRFWERTDLTNPDQRRQFGGFYRNTGTRTSPRFERRTQGGPFTEEFQICDAVRQNSVRAVDWNDDGQLDLLAGDTDGFIWFFQNQSRRSSREKRKDTGEFSSAQFQVFTSGQKLRSGNMPLSVTDSGGHARFDVCDWNNDARKDLLVADGQGTLTLFLGNKSKGVLATGQKITANGKPIQLGGRASVLVCDWDNDARKDVVLADEKGYYFCQNIGTDGSPVLAEPAVILFGGKAVSYVRPNLGSFLDWDGDGKKDFIGCHFENSIRFYRNIGLGLNGQEPQFADPEGITLLQGESPQMISGVEVVDWNGDGDLDILTGQGHGGSGLRFYERDWIEDQLRGTPPTVTIGRFEAKR